MVYNTYNLHNINTKRMNQDKLKTVSVFINKKYHIKSNYKSNSHSIHIKLKYYHLRIKQYHLHKFKCL